MNHPFHPFFLSQNPNGAPLLGFAELLLHLLMISLPLRVNKKQPDCTQSKINDMFDLDRAKIVKHKLIGRGNFGLVFEGNSQTS